MANAKINSIGLFIDGNYFVLLEKGLGSSSRVNIKGLIKFIQKTIAEKYSLENSVITDFADQK